MLPTASIASPWGQRFVRQFLGTFAVILFGLLGHQLAQEPDTVNLSELSYGPVTSATTLSSHSVQEIQEPTAAVPVMTSYDEGPVLELVSPDESRHLPGPPFSSTCLLLAVVLLLVAMATPRRTFLQARLARRVRATAGRRESRPSWTRVALSVSRT